MKFIKIVKQSEKKFQEVYDVKRYKMQIGDNLLMANYSLDTQILKIDEKK